MKELKIEHEIENQVNLGKETPKFWEMIEESSSWSYLIAKIPFSKGEKLMDLYDLPISCETDRFTITKCPGEYFNTTGKTVSRLNHSCDPNLIIDVNNWSIIARQDVKVNEQLTFNYLQTEYTMSEAFYCLCGKDLCFGYIEGFKYLPNKAKRFMNLHYSLPKYFLEDSMDD